MNNSLQLRHNQIASRNGFRLILGKRARARYPVTRFSLADPLVRRFTYGFGLASLLAVATFSAVYLHYARVIEKRMAGPLSNNAGRIYARPLSAKVGDEINEQSLISYLHRAGYSEEQTEDRSFIGTYRLLENAIEVNPGPGSILRGDAAVVRFNGDRISAISNPGGGSWHQDALELEPALLTAFSEGQNRAKRQLVTYDQIPEDLVNAVVAVEDRRYFSHAGINFFRLIQAAMVDVLHQHRSQGGSTLTMQLSRGFFLTPEKTLQRKAAEAVIAVELEQRYSKQRIFEMYANHVPLGQRGTFSINGFGEASRAFFNKEIGKLTLPEAALLAGILQRPSYLSPFRYPDRAVRRRNLVLDAMVETGAISASQAEQAKATPLQLSAEHIAEGDAPTSLTWCESNWLSITARAT